ncbi:ATP-binding protein [Chondrinema litorale]|uniref:ATP-binding protein n=1 Tax=Chondrinema litorale TaxID=2994555 RepID=UPI002542A2EB|nr:ATP-binding protein [Chondrinema litorale]UZR92797.1 ATP-binding protein [Chondrinema litorale]
MPQAENNRYFEQPESCDITLQDILSILIVDVDSGEVVGYSDNIERIEFKLSKEEIFFKTLFPYANDISNYTPKGKFKIIDIEVSVELKIKSIVTYSSNFLFFHFEKDEYNFCKANQSFASLFEFTEFLQDINDQVTLKNFFLNTVSESFPDFKCALHHFNESGLPNNFSEGISNLVSENNCDVSITSVSGGVMQLLKQGLPIWFSNKDISNSTLLNKKTDTSIDSSFLLAKYVGEISYHSGCEDDDLLRFCLIPVFAKKSLCGTLSFISNQNKLFSFENIAYLQNLIQAYSSQKLLLQKESQVLENENFSLLLQNSSDIVTILDKNFTIKYLSKSVNQILGINLEKYTSDWHKIIHLDDRKKFFAYLENVKAGKKQKDTIEFRIKNSIGNYIYLETKADNLIDKPGIDGILCNSRDITQKVKAHRRLYKFQKIIESTRNGIIILDHCRPEFPIVFVNDGIKNLTHKNANEFVGRSWELLNEFFVKNDNYTLYRKCVYETKPLEISLSMQALNQKKTWVKVQIIPVYNELSRSNSSVVLVLSNISSEIEIHEKLKEYSEKLHTSNEELQTFAYVASHDLQEPLRTIAGFSELLSDLYVDKIDDEANEYLRFIQEATERMKKLISDLLQFSRLSTAEDFIKEVQVKKIFIKAIDNLKTLINENKASITHDDFPSIFTNELLLLQVFQNLISNSIKYRSNLPPIIHIHVKRIANAWIFGVEDNGIGIEEKYFDRIFIIFQRLHTSDKYSGTGIGLSICKKIIEKYGGKIWVKSKIGEGSIFYFSIPDII